MKQNACDSFGDLDVVSVNYKSEEWFLITTRQQFCKLQREEPCRIVTIFCEGQQKKVTLRVLELWKG